MPAVELVMHASGKGCCAADVRRHLHLETYYLDRVTVLGASNTNNDEMACGT